MTDSSRVGCPGSDLMVWDVKKTWLLNKARWMFESSDAAAEHSGKDLRGRMSDEVIVKYWIVSIVPSS